MPSKNPPWNEERIKRLKKEGTYISPEMKADPKSPAPPGGENCNNCVYFGPDLTSCRRASPTGDVRVMGAWPIVGPTEWCGNWDT